VVLLGIALLLTAMPTPAAAASAPALQATGLALPGSDLDVVLLGTPCPSTKNAAEGFRIKDRQTVRTMLVRLKRALIRAGLAKDSGLCIIDARVPLCKGTVKFTLRQEEVLAALREDEAAAAGCSRQQQQQQQHNRADCSEFGFPRGASSSSSNKSSSSSSGSGSTVSALSAVVAMVKDAVRRSGMGMAAPSRQQQVAGSSSSSDNTRWEVELPVDLSLGVENGAAAVSFMTCQVR
jgi:hypothetical protein